MKLILLAITSLASYLRVWFSLDHLRFGENLNLKHLFHRFLPKEHRFGLDLVFSIFSRFLELVDLGDQLVKVPPSRFISSLVLFVSEVGFQNGGEGSSWWQIPIIGKLLLGIELWWWLISVKRVLLYRRKGRFLLLLESILVEQEIIDKVSEFLPLVLFISHFSEACSPPRFVRKLFLYLIWAVLEDSRRFRALGALEMSGELSRSVSIVYLLKSSKESCLINCLRRPQ